MLVVDTVAVIEVEMGSGLENTSAENEAMDCEVASPESKKLEDPRVLVDTDSLAPGESNISFANASAASSIISTRTGALD